ncbi:MAG TPA: periplasmic heavy metal sensor [Gemmatimonadales bacterium]|nr:periplasmic heavy metal sensor [Gemmatimonadales bacterium]
MTGMLNRPWKAALLLAATFVAGGLAGGALCHLLPWGTPPGRDAGGIVKRLTDELGLTPAQRDSVRAVLERSHPAMDSAWAEVRPRIETVRARIRSDIAAQLTPEQRAKYDAMMQRREEPRRGTEPRR